MPPVPWYTYEEHCNDGAPQQRQPGVGEQDTQSQGEQAHKYQEQHLQGPNKCQLLQIIIIIIIIITITKAITIIITILILILIMLLLISLY